MLGSLSPIRQRCHENNCELPADAPLGQHFCAEHANAGKTITCAYVVEREVVDMGSRSLHNVLNASPCESHEEAIVRRCNGEVIMVEGCRVCKKCGQGSAIAKTVAAAGQEDTNLDKSLKRSAESLRIANNVWGSFSINVDPDHAPAWTKRRRLRATAVRRSAACTALSPCRKNLKLTTSPL